jgi:hypothetical protein
MNGCAGERTDCEIGSLRGFRAPAAKAAPETPVSTGTMGRFAAALRRRTGINSNGEAAAAMRTRSTARQAGRSTMAAPATGNSDR